MHVSFSHNDTTNWNWAVLVVGLVEENLEDQLKRLSPFFEGSLSEAIKQQSFKAKANEMTSFQLPKGKLVLVGLGKAKDLSLAQLRKSIANGSRSSIGIKGTLGLMFPWDQFELQEAVRAAAESARLSLFKDLRFRSEPDPQKVPDSLEFIGLDESTEKLLHTVGPTCAGVELARELVGAPPNLLTPESLAKTAIEIAQEYDLAIKILEQEDCKEEGMGAYLAVAQGSDLAPNFIHLTYKPDGVARRRLAIVGKGLTFDSGGYNLKVGASQIEMMKFDMGGSAAVIGAARAIAELRPKEVEVHFIVAACENMVNGSAVHPGDIVTASNGKTIEINNTDAEGRLTLADALVYACKLQPDAIVDLATLTGACVVALGDEIAGLWSNNDQLAELLIQAGENAGEELWRMPLKSSYKEGLKSMLADIKNTGPRSGGSITAALFLREFVEESIPWAHIDIAGTVWAEKQRDVNPAGATGYGVRTLVNWACLS